MGLYQAASEPRCLFFIDDVMMTFSYNVGQVTTALPGTQACALDWIKAYHCSPIMRDHKHFLPSSWRGLIFHCAPFSSSTSGNIQGSPADAFRDILLAVLLLATVFKWVDDYNIWHSPTFSRRLASGEVYYEYGFSLTTILNLSKPLGIK